MRRIGHAQCLGDHVAMRMRARLFGGQVALRDQFLHHAVVLAELGQLAVAPKRPRWCPSAVCHCDGARRG
ncbi:hypothetical protein WR25_20615 [Diploscapter pachys]|uniref:Uncharacterized protein n=1 Tax=Diploscapter pachys TaxID=2018661 RepID=A0A2A2M5W6_9BILA|nr:hypothetical protein WR25_20615 [Diploscapter pachys]